MAGQWVTSGGIKVNDEMGKYESNLSKNAGTLLSGRTTYKILEGYWPQAP